MTEQMPGPDTGVKEEAGRGGGGGGGEAEAGRDLVVMNGRGWWPRGW